MKRPYLVPDGHGGVYKAPAYAPQKKKIELVPAGHNGVHTDFVFSPAMNDTAYLIDQYLKSDRRNDR